jgi:hypothetical protein
MSFPCSIRSYELLHTCSSNTSWDKSRWTPLCGPRWTRNHILSRRGLLLKEDEQWHSTLNFFTVLFLRRQWEAQWNSCNNGLVISFCSLGFFFTIIMSVGRFLGIPSGKYPSVVISVIYSLTSKLLTFISVGRFLEIGNLRSGYHVHLSHLGCEIFCNVGRFLEIGKDSSEYHHVTRSITSGS